MADEQNASVDLRDLVARVSTATGFLPNDVDKIVRETLNQIAEGLGREGKVSIREFGIFRADFKRGGERKTGLPRYKEQGGVVQVVPQWVVKFRPARDLRERVHKQLMGED